jgi:hypothetical protein
LKLGRKVRAKRVEARRHFHGSRPVAESLFLAGYPTCVAGGGLIVFGLARARIQERIEEDGSSLRFRLVFGRSGKFTTLKKNEIVAVSVEAAIAVEGRAYSQARVPSSAWSPCLDPANKNKL